MRAYTSVLSSPRLLRLGASAYQHLRPKPPVSAAAPQNSSSTTAKLSPDTIRALDTSDPAKLPATLLQLGFPENLIRELLIIQDIRQHLQRIVQQLQEPSSRHYWQNPGWFPALDNVDMELFGKVEVQLAALIGLTKEQVASLRPAQSLDFLSPAKRDQIAAIQRDYDAMREKLEAEINGFELPDDQARRELLDHEQARDIAALLSPEEKRQYDLRYSETADTVRNFFGPKIQTEAEYLALYDEEVSWQKTRDQLIANNQAHLTEDAHALHRERVDAILGRERTDPLYRGIDPELELIAAASNRLNLPPSTSKRILALRAETSASSRKIAEDKNLTPEQRAAALTQLAQQATAKMTPLFGTPSAANAYLSKTEWYNALTNGQSFRFNNNGRLITE